MECKKLIWDILSRLDAEYESPAQVSELDYECLTMLDELAAECSEALLQTGQELLNHSDESDDGEYKFQVVLQALVSRDQPGALELNAEALVSKKTQDKEAYVELLESFEDPRTVPALMYAIEADHSTGEEEGGVRYKAINALRRVGAKEVASMIIPYVQDQAYRVRGAAIEFLISFNIHEAAPIFVDQLAEEEIPSNLEKLIDGLVSWKQTDALPVLRELLASDWVRNNQALQAAVSYGILTLEPIA